MKNNILYLIFLILFFNSCNDISDAEPVNEEEVISKIVLEITDLSNNQTQTYYYQQDVDIPYITLNNNTLYKMNVTFWNYNESINTEIIEERNDHFIVYSQNNLNILLQRTNEDFVRNDGKKLGIFTQIQTQNPNNGSLEIRLIHLPETVDDANGFGTVLGGETDVEIAFPVIIQ